MEPKIFSSQEHHIRHSLIDTHALHVLKELSKAGFVAYLVGGGVRDLLRNKKPKDFDISTSATPRQIKNIFKKRCFLIGRRFRLAHIRYHNNIIEVSTFRSGEHHHSDELIVRDNIWGTPVEDVIRRDFTMNALFYNPEDDTIIDYVGGYDDIQQGVLRCIGDAKKRFKQDPVRMIRLLKFKARFNYSIDPHTSHALHSCLNEITKSSPPRILEEIFRMQESGHFDAFFQLLREHNFSTIFFHTVEDFCQNTDDIAITEYLRIADTYNLETHGPILERPILMACLFFPIVHFQLLSSYPNEDNPPSMKNIIDTISEIMATIARDSFFQFPRRMLLTIKFILISQYRFTPLSDKPMKRQRFMRQAEFPLALRFLKIRTLIDSSINKQYITWSKQWNSVKNTITQTKPVRRRPKKWK